MGVRDVFIPVASSHCLREMAAESKRVQNDGLRVPMGIDALWHKSFVE